MRAGELAAEMRRPVERRRGGIDLDAGNLGSSAGADDLHSPVAHAEAVKPCRVEARHLYRRQSERAVRPARQDQNGLLETDVGEPDLPTREFDERELQPSRGERELRSVRTWRAD